MEPDPRAFLWDVLQSAQAIARFLDQRSLEDYHADDMLRGAVERRFEIIGEALGRLAKASPTIATRVPDLSAAIALRNTLIHGYAKVDNDTVWRIAQEDLPVLRAVIISLLDELGG